MERAILYTETIDPIECGGLITFRKRWVVEHIVDEVFDLTLECHHSLPDVDKFTRTFTDNMYPQQLMGLQMEDQFQEASLISDDLPAGDLAVLGFANFIWNASF